MLEALVIAACLQNQGGCSESSAAYYANNKDAQLMVKNIEEYGRRLTNGREWLVYVATPIYAAASGKPANFHIYKRFTLSIDFKQELIAVQWSY
jgi:hypothetical protein